MAGAFTDPAKEATQEHHSGATVSINLVFRKDDMEKRSLGRMLIDGWKMVRSKRKQ